MTSLCASIVNFVLSLKDSNELPSTILVLGSVLLGVYLLLRKPRGLPPGPRWTLPIVGDLLSVYDKSDNNDSRLLFRRLRKKYGDILSVYLGGQLFVIINGWPNVKDALVTNGDIFLDRPINESTRLFRDDKGVLSASGQTWKEQRKFAVETLRKLGFGRTIIEDKVHEEIEEMVATLVKEKGKPYDMNRLFKLSVANVIANIVLGRRFETSNPRFLNYMVMLDEAIPVIAGTSALNLFPYLRYISGDPFGIQKAVDQINSAEKAIFEPIINEHYKSYDENNTDDFISFYIKQIKKEESTGIKSTINDKNLLKLTGDLFLAGVDATSTTMRWCILYLLHYPKVYQKCYEEVQDVVGSERLPSMKDKVNMPYINAVIIEILRITNIAGSAMIRSVVRDTVYQGYRIPKEALVFINIDSFLASDDVWGDADVFRPERFIDDNGQIIRREELIPFGLGKRNCIGETMAKIELFLFLISLIQRFDFQPEDPNNLPTLKPVVRGISPVPVPFRVIAVRRK